MIKLYVVQHKKIDLNEYKLDSCYQTIRVGAYAQEKSDLRADNTGEHISWKNSNYCELTALFWIWKNDHVADIVGLCHYRRFFTKSMLSVHPKHFLTSPDIEKYLQKYDVIVARKTFSYRGAYNAYLDCGYEKDLQITKEAIKTLYPNYLVSYETVFEKSAGNYPANMMIAKKELFDAYCKWLFDLLEYVENKTDLADYSQQEARVFGYLAERLLGVWLDRNKLKIKEIRIVNTECKKDLLFYCTEFLKGVGLYQAIKKFIFMVKKMR